ncbi:Replication factor C subunit 2 [Gracilariopsis chorda]|uniref:Replication factor C subunit 2 n=1 Tax=Gracilariopsis chorda TaxID=448386 RepID=A0A2V3IJK7_9FLOR|nr:Replication factor C subunit 2 [Gracilariopsis chorda]|eukprot:PXF41310.1 Replication factor C subunit 2 [Gracilariopsis chorda]
MQSSSKAHSKPSSQQTYELPWVEKYRPNTLDQVVGNPDVIDRLRVVAKNGNMPNILLAGPPGCGKTTSIMALARESLGNQLKNAVLELNASDDRGIDTVRTKIKMFAQTKVTLPPGRHKIVLLDEADSMTPAAQQALRRTMELHSNTTRFALACNLSSKIIEPIQSRCAVVRFRRLTDEQVAARLKQVLDTEKVPHDQSGINAAVFTADGDMRIALNNVQSTFNGFGFVNEKNLNKVCDQPHPKVAAEFITLCLEKDIDSAFAKVMFLVDQGYSCLDIIQTIFRVARGMKVDKEITKLNMLREIGLIHMRMADGVTSPIQLAALASRLCQA